MFKLAIKTINFIKKRLYFNKTFFLYKHNEHHALSSPASVKIATKNNIADVLTFQTFNKLREFERFIENGDIGYLAYMDGWCVHRSWVQKYPKQVELHFSLPYQLKENEMYIHYCETFDDYRGKNIYPHVLSTITKDFSEYDVLINVEQNNIPSIKGIEKAGFKKYKTFKVIGILGFTFKREIVA